MFHLSAIDPSVATNHAAAWERQPQLNPQPQPQPQPQPAAPPAVTCYGPYGRVAATPGPMTIPYTFTSMTYAHAAPSRVTATPDDLRNTRQDASYQAYVEREHAIQLARGSQSDELEPTRRRPALPSSAVSRPEPAALRATRLRHPPVPKPPQLTMLSHMPDRLS